MTKRAEFYDRMMQSRITSGTAWAGATRCRYEVISQDFDPELPYFVGYISTKDHYYFISEAVPPHFRAAMIAHEDFCSTQKECDHSPGHCARAVDVEMALIPIEDQADYVAMRIAFFKVLIERSKNGNPDFLREITASRDKLKMYAPA